MEMERWNLGTSRMFPMPKPDPVRLHSLRTGGQTGVDRAVLDLALASGLKVRGWCPRGRRAEDGPLHRRYPLDETPSADYAQRTEWNVRDSDGTLVLRRDKVDPGTALTIRLASRQARPLLLIDLANPLESVTVEQWIQRSGVQHLNIAGPRESQSPGIYEEACTFLEKLFIHLF